MYIHFVRGLLSDYTELKLVLLFIEQEQKNARNFPKYNEVNWTLKLLAVNWSKKNEVGESIYLLLLPCFQQTNKLSLNF